MAGTIVADDIQHSTAGSVGTEYVVQGSAKAWINFNGTGTIATRDSFNVSSITDNGTGRYTTAPSNAMSNANGSIASQAHDGAGAYNREGTTDMETSSNFDTSCFNTGTNALTDLSRVHLSVFGDLA